MKKLFCCSCAIIAFLLMTSCQRKDKDKYITIEGYAQGGIYSVTLNLKGVKEKPEDIRNAIQDILEEIDGTLSGYNKNSLLSRFNAGEDIVPNQLFMDAYDIGYQIYDETRGVVDVACAPLFDMWGFGFKTGDMPTDDEVEIARRNCGLGRCYAASDNFAAEKINAQDLLLENEPVLPQLNYNAIAQGYSCDLVAEYLYSIGVKDMLVNIGEIFCDGKNPSGQPWTVGIDKPVDGNDELGAQIQGVFKVPSGPHGVVTSGNYRKFYIKDGKKYAHTIDPRTGYPVDHSLLSATVIAENAMLADAYATYCMVVGLEASKEFFAERTDMEACLIYDQDGEFETWCTSGFILEE